MVIHPKLKRGNKSKKCECGRKILSVRIARTRTNSEEATPAKKASVRAAIRAMTPLSRRIDSCDDETSSKKTAQTGASSVTAEKSMCLKCKMKLGELNTNLPEPECKKKKRPIIERLRVVKATTSSLSDQSRKRKCRLGRRYIGNAVPLPNEVYLEQNSRELFSESTMLGFDGFSPSSALTKKAPTRFTFDDVVPSNSSIETQESDKGCLDQCGSAILTDLAEAERGGSTARGFSLKEGFQPQRERSVTSSTIDTEMDIELSESGKAAEVDDKFNIFSPSNHDHGDSEGAEGKHGIKSAKEQPALGWLFDFSFLAING